MTGWVRILFFSFSLTNFLCFRPFRNLILLSSSSLSILFNFNFCAALEEYTYTMNSFDEMFPIFLLYPQTNIRLIKYRTLTDQTSFNSLIKLLTSVALASFLRSFLDNINASTTNRDFFLIYVRLCCKG